MREGVEEAGSPRGPSVEVPPCADEDGDQEHDNTGDGEDRGGGGRPELLGIGADEVVEHEPGKGGGVCLGREARLRVRRRGIVHELDQRDEGRKCARCGMMTWRMRSQREPRRSWRFQGCRPERSETRIEDNEGEGAVRPDAIGKQCDPGERGGGSKRKAGVAGKPLDRRARMPSGLNIQKRMSEPQAA